MPKRKKLPRSDKPLSLRIPPQLMERIQLAAQKLAMSESEVIRLAVGVGLERLKRIDYDLAKSICDAADPKPAQIPFPSTVVLPSPAQEAASRLNEPEPPSQPGTAPVPRNTRAALKRMVAKETPKP